MIAVNDVWTIALEQKVFGQQMFNTAALQVTATPANVSEQTFVDYLFNDVNGIYNDTGNWRLTLLACQALDVQHIAWHVRRVSPVVTQPFVIPLFTNTQGTGQSPAVNANTAASITRYGSGPGKRYRGRVAVGGLGDPALVSGRLNNLAMTALTTFSQRLYGTVATAGGYTFTRGYWSPAHVGIVGGQPVNYPALYVPCVAATVRDTQRVQRSRTIGVGN